MAQTKYLNKTIGTLVILLIAYFLITMVTGGGSSKTEDHVVFMGSTSVQPFLEKLAEVYGENHPEIGIDIQGGGSGAGIKAATSGIADIGMSSRHLKSEEQENLWKLEIAKDALAVIVHPDNPVKELSIKQLRGIYSGEIKNWEALGGKNKQIHLITREDGSGTRSAFEESVMRTEKIDPETGNVVLDPETGKKVMEDIKINPKSIVQASNGAVKLLVADDPAAIGFISLGLVDKRVLALRLEGIAAEEKTVLDGTYPLSRPFLLVVTNPEKLSAHTMKFINFILSEEGQSELKKEGLIPEDGQNLKFTKGN